MSSEQSEHFEGIVLYTDGSCRPTNPGNIGWGAHGYHYTTELDSKGTGLSSQAITHNGYIPSSGKNNEVSRLVKPITYFDIFGSTTRIGSNNTAEVEALHFALEKIKDINVPNITVYTDSEYVRRGISEWASTWAKNNWKKSDGSDVPNAESWKRLLITYNEIRNKNCNIKVNWIRGHADNFGNEHADKLSVVAVQHSMEGVENEIFKATPAQGYWKSDVDKHPFINFRRLYFNSLPTLNRCGHYYLSEPGGPSSDGDWIIGKKFPDSSYSVIRLTEPEKVIEEIKSKQFSISSDINAVVLMRMDKVYEPETYDYINNYGKFALLQDTRNLLNVVFLDKKPLTIELNPAGLSLRAIENFSMLDELLDIFNSFKNGEVQKGYYSTLEVHDITNHFFTTEEVKKKKEIVLETKLKPVYGVGFKDTMVEVVISQKEKTKSINIPLILGMDLLPRNNLKKIESLNPKVSLLTWKESEDTIRYAIVIEIDTGIGIWSNYFANRIFL